MSNFLIITVYEVIATPLVTYIISKVKEQFNEHLLIPFENSLKFFFSTIPWADENLLKVIISLMFTWFLIWFIFKLSELLYSNKKIREYINWWPRKELFTWEFWAKLLLTFMITWWLVFFIYPAFWALLIILTLIAKSKEIEEQKNEKNFNNK